MLNKMEDLAEHEKGVRTPKDFLLKDLRAGKTLLIQEATCSHVFTNELGWMESFTRDVSEGPVIDVHFPRGLY